MPAHSVATQTAFFQYEPQVLSPCKHAFPLLPLPKPRESQPGSVCSRPLQKQGCLGLAGKGVFFAKNMYLQFLSLRTSQRSVLTSACLPSTAQSLSPRYDPDSFLYLRMQQLHHGCPSVMCFLGSQICNARREHEDQ